MSRKTAKRQQFREIMKWYRALPPDPPPPPADGWTIHRIEWKLSPRQMWNMRKRRTKVEYLDLPAGTKWTDEVLIPFRA